MSVKSTHTAIVGAGIGGLAAALLRAAAGDRVTLLEAQRWLGGKMRTRPSAAGPVDAGPTVLTQRPVLERLFAQAGDRLEDHLTLHRVPVLARHVFHDGSTLDLQSDPEASAEAIAAFAGPREAATFRAFHAEASRLYDAFEGPMMGALAPSLPRVALALAPQAHRLLPAMAPWATLWGRLARFRDPRLRMLFARYATYVGGRPTRAPALLGLIWSSEARGVWMAEGGMAAVAGAIARLAEAKGAEIRTETPVRALRPGWEIDTDAGTERADRVIFNGDPHALASGMLGDAVTRAAPKTRARSLSALVWTLAAETDLPAHTVVFPKDYAQEFRDIDAGRLPREPTVYVHRMAGPGRLQLIVNAPARGVTVEETARCTETTFTRLARAGISLTPCPPTRPQDFARLFPGTEGALYGAAPEGLMAPFARARPKTPLPGLWLVGGGTHPGPGVPMAIRSALLVATAMDPASTSASTRTAMPGGTSTGSMPRAPAA